ncbi:MAG: class I SAM-dependent rRNA methyltransferase [Bacteroidales bacterium]|nr:class I SAM-dependent rRNA methyltransferase [Bacteroidales bacterium]
MVTITLKPGKEQSLLRFHPWIFSGAIAKMSGQPEEGEVVEVQDALGSFLCLGHYQIGSIMVRVLSFEPTKIDQKFYTDRIGEAYFLRKKIGLAESETTNAFRLIHGEGDYLPGLVIDMYNGVAVVQMHSVGMYRDREYIYKALIEVVGDQLKAIYNKSEDTLPFKAGIELQNTYVYGQRPEDNTAMENGLKFFPDWERGQKTGFFVDQRENRALIERYSKGRNVLNMFCYTGGFSMYAMRGGATKVHSVDSSERAIELTRNNVELNFPGDSRHQATAEDAFKFMEQTEGEFDLMILDPPAFAKHYNVLNNALKGYRRLNTKALEMIKPGGILFTFSCSQVVSKEVFRTMVFSSAAKARRRVSVLHQMSQPADHPVNIYHPEGEYLKGLVLQVW